MKKKLTYFLIVIVLLASLTAFLNMNVTTRRGVDYKVCRLKIPLYLKILDFLDRHYNYKHLARSITAGILTEEERVIKILEWTYQNIRRNPDGFPVFDDHVWYVIIRGHGVHDQFNVIFSVLCNYAGFQGFYKWTSSSDQQKTIPLSFIKVNRRWCVFDPYRGVYFKDKFDKLACIEDLKNGDFTIIPINRKPELDYMFFFKNLKPVNEGDFDWLNLHSPFDRAVYILKKIFKR
ncbi:transglutaminase-like domain-containing protein [Candidatus Omnitrophota bacterium]